MIASDTYRAVEGGGRWKSFIIVSPLESKAKTNFKTGRSGFNTIFESYLFIIFNKIYFMDDDETTKEEFTRVLKDEYGVLVGYGYSRGGELFRACTHIDVDGKDVDHAIESILAVQAR